MNRTTEILAVALALFLPVVASAQSPSPVGVLLEIRPPAFIAQSETAPARQLDPKADVMKKVFAGQRVRVGAGGQLRIALPAGVRVIASPEWTVLQEAQGLTPEQVKIAQALRRYGSPGGTRGLGSALWSPADGGAVRPSSMTVRWAPPKKPSKVAIRIETESGAVLWSEANIDSAAGRLDSAEARRALTAARGDAGVAELILVMSDSSGMDSRAAFAVLSPQQEAVLDGDLAAWDRAEDPMLRAIGRAYELGRRRLFVEAADEIEAALEKAPHSRELIEAALEANRRTGNDARARALRTRLEEIGR